MAGVGAVNLSRRARVGRNLRLEELGTKTEFKELPSRPLKRFAVRELAGISHNK
jgi:hypothetical protein